MKAHLPQSFQPETPAQWRSGFGWWCLDAASDQMGKGSLEAVVLSQQVFLALLWCACW